MSNLFEHKGNFLWAKKNDRDGSMQWLSLKQHSADTRYVAIKLWENWLTDRQYKLIIENDGYDNELAKKLIGFLATIHDLGKATPAFQTKKSFYLSQDLDRAVVEKLQFAGYSDLIPISPEKSPHALASHKILSDLGLHESLCVIISAHHGKPISAIEVVHEQNAYLTNYFQSENEEDGLSVKWKQTQKAMVDWALELNGLTDLDELLPVNQPSQILLSGLLIAADWIASNDNYFPLLEIDQTDVDVSSRLDVGWQKWNFSGSWNQLPTLEVEEHYKRRFSFKPNPFQKAVADEISTIKDPGIIIIEASMGIGKTEAALIAAEQLSKKEGHLGLFFGLPTQATSNGIFPRIKEWLSNLQTEQSSRTSLRLVHGKAHLNSDFQSLSRNINVDGEGGVVVNQWFSGKKKSIMDDFVVGTIDQFLMLSLKQKHLALKHLGFSKKIVVLDEVHAYDAYMSQYMFRALEWLGAYSVPVIVLSATLPKKTREELIISYMAGKGHKRRDIRKVAEALSTPSYPVVTYTDGMAIKLNDQFPAQKSKKIDIGILEETNLIDRIGLSLGHGGVVGVIVNTVRKAQSLARECAELFGDHNVMLLHSQFIATHRVEREKDLLSLIGKGSKRPARKVIIGTQVIEQSLDIDLDVLYTELCPMDLLLQRIGRVHRHEIERPSHHKTPKVYVFGCDPNYEFDSGSNAVYGGYLLAITQDNLPEVINIPDDMSSLVEKVYGEVGTLNPVLNELKADNDERLKAKKAKADVFRINAPVYKETLRNKASLIGWIENSHPNQSEEYAYAQVRDIEDTIEVIALFHNDEGYSIYNQEENLSDEIRQHAVAKKIAQQTITLPRILCNPRTIDSTIKFLEKYKAEHFPDWDNSIWLEGALGIIFDERRNFEIGGLTLHYDNNIGLTYERRE